MEEIGLVTPTPGGTPFIQRIYVFTSTSQQIITFQKWIYAWYFSWFLVIAYFDVCYEMSSIGHNFQGTWLQRQTLDNMWVNSGIYRQFVHSNLQSTGHAVIWITPDSKVHGANMGPTWVLSGPDGPHVGPMNLAIRDNYNENSISNVLKSKISNLKDFCCNQLE